MTTLVDNLAPAHNVLTSLFGEQDSIVTRSGSCHPDSAKFLRLAGKHSAVVFGTDMLNLILEGYPSDADEALKDLTIIVERELAIELEVNEHIADPKNAIFGSLANAVGYTEGLKLILEKVRQAQA